MGFRDGRNIFGFRCGFTPETKNISCLLAGWALVNSCNFSIFFMASYILA